MISKGANNHLKNNLSPFAPLTILILTVCKAVIVISISCLELFAPKNNLKHHILVYSPTFPEL